MIQMASVQSSEHTLFFMFLYRHLKYVLTITQPAYRYQNKDRSKKERRNKNQAETKKNKDGMQWPNDLKINKKNSVIDDEASIKY